MTSFYDIIGVVPESSDSETSKELFDDMEPTDEAMGLKTPPRKSILRRSPVRTPLSTPVKRVKFPRKSISLNLTPACSPAYDDRESIAKEDRANVTFCLEKSAEITRIDSPSTAAVRTPPPPLSQVIVTASPTPGSSTQEADRPVKYFDISKYINMIHISSPKSRKSFSTSSINKIGLLHSTPIRSGYASPTMGLGIHHRNFIGTPQRQN